MKKILIFSLAYFPKHVGGAEVAIKEKTDRISDIEFHMVTLRYDSTLPKVEKIGSVLVHRIGFTKHNPTMADLKKFPLHYNKLWFQFGAALKAFSLHRKYKYDAIWAMMAHSCGVPAALFNLFAPRVPLVLELQEGDPPEYIERLMRPLWPLFSRAFTRPAVISVISTFLGNWARKRGFRGEIVLVPNAVNTKHFSQTYSSQELEALKTMLGKKSGDIYIITTSRLVKKNACDDVIKALALLPNNYHFIILGTGPDEEMLRVFSRAKKLDSRVHFLGQISHSELPKYLKISDVFIRPSLSEGMGNSFIEAMAAEVPVIATQEGGIADFLFDPELNPEKPPTGRAVPVNDPKAIARQIRAFIEKPKETEVIVANAKKLAFEKYDWELIARNMKEKVFDAILQR